MAESPDGEGPAGLAPGCCGGSGAVPGAVGPIGNYYLTAEYLYWWTKKSQVPPLVTTGPLSSGGVLGQIGTSVLFGGSDVDIEGHSGGRFGLGLWLTDFHKAGAEFNYFFLATQGVDFDAVAEGNGLLARPVTVANNGLPNAFLVAIPGLTAGRIRVTDTTRLQGLEINAVANAHCADNYRLDLLLGFRWMELNEGLGIGEVSEILPGIPGFGSRTLLSDQFDTQNRYYGGQIGARAEYYSGPWSLNLTAKVALGSTREDLSIHGSTLITQAGITQAVNTGLLATASNTGGFNRNDFAVVPEVGLKVDYQFSPCMRLFAGCNFLYWSRVIRPGDQVDTTINVNQLLTSPPFNPQLGVARPAVPFKESDFWATGVSLGMEFRF
jgi:hypothetical protein